MKNICFQMSRKAWLVMFVTLCLSFPALAQKITVAGTVTDPSGEPLIGASVMATGSAVGTATDIDGNYTISVEPTRIAHILLRRIQHSDGERRQPHGYQCDNEREFGRA